MSNYFLFTDLTIILVLFGTGFFCGIVVGISLMYKEMSKKENE